MTRPTSILAAVPYASRSFLARNGLTQKAPAVDLSHDPHDVTPASHALRQDRRGLNKTEAAFAEWLRETYRTEPMREGLGFRLGNGCVYWPDFITFQSFPSVRAYEVKGFMRDDAAVKIKAAATRFPSVQFFLAFRDKSKPSGWRIEEVLP